MMKNAIIFGCGNAGGIAFQKISLEYTILAWTDNDDSLWGKEKMGIPIIQPDKVKRLCEESDIDIFIAMDKSDLVIEQVMNLGADKVFVWRNPFFYNIKGMIPFRKYKSTYYTKRNRNRKAILFISAIANIRDHKIASLIKKCGYEVCLAYLISEPSVSEPEFACIYDEIYPIQSMDELVDFVNNSEFDLVHSSSEQEFLTAILTYSNKVVIHEWHDLRRETAAISPNELAMEYLSHTRADGVIYPTKALRNNALLKFGKPVERTYVIENFISKELIPDCRLEKLSCKDGKIHAVYEGEIVAAPKENKMYFNDLWLRLAEAGIQVHFYAKYNQEFFHYLEELHVNIHYEGDFSSKQLSVEMSKYDVGLCIFNTNSINKLYLENGLPNNLYEYLNAGIPVAVGNVECHKQFVETNTVGRQVDLDGNIMQQMHEISKINISDTFLEDNDFMFEKQIYGLLELYDYCITNRDRK